MYTKQISYITGVEEGIKTLFAHQAMFRVNITSINISPHADKGEGVDTIPFECFCNVGKVISRVELKLLVGNSCLFFHCGNLDALTFSLRHLTL